MNNKPLLCQYWSHKLVNVVLLKTEEFDNPCNYGSWKWERKIYQGHCVRCRETVQESKALPTGTRWFF